MIGRIVLYKTKEAPQRSYPAIVTRTEPQTFRVTLTVFTEEKQLFAFNVPESENKDVEKIEPGTWLEMPVDPITLGRQAERVVSQATQRMDASLSEAEKRLADAWGALQVFEPGEEPDETVTALLSTLEHCFAGSPGHADPEEFELRRFELVHSYRAANP